MKEIFVLKKDEDVTVDEGFLSLIDKTMKKKQKLIEMIIGLDFFFFFKKFLLKDSFERFLLIQEILMHPRNSY